MEFNNPESIHKENQSNLKEVRRVNYAFSFDLVFTSKFTEYILKIYSFVLLFGGFFSIIGHCNSIRLNIFTNFALAVESYATTNQSTISMAKLIYLRIVRKRIQELYHRVETGQMLISLKPLCQTDLNNTKLKDEANKILKASWLSYHRRMYFYIVSVSAIIGFYFVNALGQNTYHQIIGDSNFTNINVFPTNYPIYQQYFNQLPYYPILFYFDTCADFMAGVGNLSFDGIFLAMTSHAACLLNILGKTIEFSTTKFVPKELRLKTIKECIIFQDTVYKFCDEINDLYEIVCLIQLTTSLIVLGGVIFSASSGLENEYLTFIRMTFYIAALGYEIVVFTQNGQLITDGSEKVAEAWYNCYWYDESKEFKTYVYMMIHRSNKPIYMNGWGFFKLNLPTLLTIFRTSGSYFLILKNVID